MGTPRCEFCSKVLDREKGEWDHGCLECAGHIYRDLCTKEYYCLHCLRAELTRLKAIVEILEGANGKWSCPVCHGQLQYPNSPCTGAIESRSVHSCGGTGLHPIARAAQLKVKELKGGKV